MSASLYRTMLTVRLLEQRLQEMCDAGQAGDLHFNKGQEAIAVGVCAALRPTDCIVTHHRTICHAVAKGWDLYKLVAEILGKSTGQNGGRAGEMHLSNHEVGHDFAFQLVGTCVPVSVGLAWAVKHQKKDDVVAVFFGDAATSNGVFHEACTIASIHKLPLLLVCENNGLAGNVRAKDYRPVPKVCERMRGYWIAAVWTDGNVIDGPSHPEMFPPDGPMAESVKEAAARGVAHVRSGRGPFLVECITTRLSKHKQGQGDRRRPEELSELAKRDPLPRESERLGLTAEERDAMWASVTRELDEVFAKVAADPVAEWP